jgi:hypothetical protein
VEAEVEVEMEVEMEVGTEGANVVLEIDTETELDAVPAVLGELDETVLDELVAGGAMGAEVLSIYRLSRLGPPQYSF